MTGWAKWWLVGLAAALWGEPVTVEVRMLTPLRSWKADEGAAVRGVVIRPAAEAGRVVHGTVRKVEPVGIGIRRERARVAVEFTDLEGEDGARRPIRARVTEVENAREEVDGQGRIRGILAASNPLGLTRGFWFRPRRNLLLRGPAGLTGACGMAWARMALGPVGAVGFIGARLALTRMPQPEIDLPAGTELTLRVDEGWPAGREGERTELPVSGEVAAYLAELPAGVAKADGVKVADVINLAFVGSREELDGAFRAAGWLPAEPLTRKSFGRAYRAFAAREGYGTAPVSKLYYAGRLPDMVYQKSLNSIGKRHHIRIWRVDAPGGGEMWVGAATHDVNVAFDRRRMSLTHRIDPEIDREREKVLADLRFAGALAGVGTVERRIEEVGRTTDGAVRVAVLQAGAQAGPEWTGEIRPPARAASRAARRLVLETRQYLLRDNTYYLGYLAARRLARR